MICLGAVIKGDTDHYEFVAREAAHGIAEVAVNSGVPVIFGVLTTHTMQHALDRLVVGKVIPDILVQLRP
ncbi:MAG: hypothetical protein CM1200mP3_17170 [Chloroflexota bacterium]|nr:MAG: hypothetical protein CM1200mP3_17170 [Chloroflexota bacterium]